MKRSAPPADVSYRMGTFDQTRLEEAKKSWGKQKVVGPDTDEQASTNSPSSQKPLQPHATERTERTAHGLAKCPERRTRRSLFLSVRRSLSRRRFRLRGSRRRHLHLPPTCILRGDHYPSSYPIVPCPLFTGIVMWHGGPLAPWHASQRPCSQPQPQPLLRPQRRNMKQMGLHRARYSAAASVHPYARPEPRTRPNQFFNVDPVVMAPSAALAERHDYWTPRAMPQAFPRPLAHVNLWSDFSDSKPQEIVLMSKKSATECAIRWRLPNMPLHQRQQLDLQVFHNDALLESIKVDRKTEEFSWKTVPGDSYYVKFESKTAAGVVTGFGDAKFRATFCMKEMEKLMKMAYDFCSGGRLSMHSFHVLYRCKPEVYWDDIKYNCQFVMKKYIKDDNGQAASPINGRIFGLFFSARLLPGGHLPSSSPFGNVRFSIPAQVLLDPQRINMYFSDFYCNKLTHYVTIVLCVKGSQTDKFCYDKLIPLPAKNPFISVVEGRNGSYEFAVSKKVWVEMYFTEDVPLNWGRFDRVIATGLGTSRIGGLPHNKTCTVCNLYPIGNNESTDELVDHDEFSGDSSTDCRPTVASMVAHLKSHHDLPAEDCEEIVNVMQMLVDSVSYETDVGAEPVIKLHEPVFDGADTHPIEVAMNHLKDLEAGEQGLMQLVEHMYSAHNELMEKFDDLQQIVNNNRVEKEEPTET